LTISTWSFFISRAYCLSDILPAGLAALSGFLPLPLATETPCCSASSTAADFTSALSAPTLFIPSFFLSMFVSNDLLN
jgi:hypothetical protein